MLRAIDGYDGQPATAAALKLASYVFVRPGELRSAEWSEFTLDGDEPVWRIPAERMKMREPHIVPLCRRAVAIRGTFTRSPVMIATSSPRSAAAVAP